MAESLRSQVAISCISKFKVWKPFIRCVNVMYCVTAKLCSGHYYTYAIQSLMNHQPSRDVLGNPVQAHKINLFYTYNFITPETAKVRSQTIGCIWLGGVHIVSCPDRFFSFCVGWPFFSAPTQKEKKRSGHETRVHNHWTRVFSPNICATGCNYRMA